MIRTEVDDRWKALDDKALIEMVLAGDPGCFVALMDRHLSAIRRRIVLMIPDMAEVEDVMQEVQLKVWAHLSSFRADSTFRTWIMRIAINESLQRVKRRHKCDDISLYHFAATTDSPFRSYARHEMSRTVRSAINGLPVKFRQIIIMRDLLELTVREVASQLNSNPQLVKTRLFRARVMLSKTLQRIRKTPAPDWRAEIAV